MNKSILDPCCGSKMFWFDKNNPNAVFCDKRKEIHTLCDGRILDINPDIICDFTSLPFNDKQFKQVVFDPPHLEKLGATSWTALKYGRLEGNWQKMLKDGFNECWRVLDDWGTLVFKWSETQIKVSEIIKIIGRQPNFGHKSGRLNQTHWMCFLKTDSEEEKIKK